MTFDPTKEYHITHFQDGDITYYEYQLSGGITLIANYLDMSREERVRYILERYDVTDVDSAVLQMITYMYADVASVLEDIEAIVD